jgi:hypothetical protein
MMELNRSNLGGHTEGGSPIRGNPSRFFGTGIVAFLDLLGFSNSLIDQWGDDEQSPLARLFRIRGSPFVKEQLGVSTGSYHTGPNGEVITEDIYRVRVHSLSDSVTVSVALPAEPTLGDFVLAFSCIALNIRFVWQAALDEGYIVRGAAELDSIFWSEAELVGPALARAYTLERDCARSARVILGPNLLSQLAQAAERDAYDWSSLVRTNRDGLISFDTRVQVTRSEDLVNLRNQVASDDRKASKYRDLIDTEGRPIECPVPSVGDLRRAATQLAASAS